MYFKILLLIIVGIATSGCQSTAVPSEVDVAEVAQPNWENDEVSLVTVPSPEALFVLTESQQHHFLSYFHAPSNASVSPHFRLANYLEQLTSNFSYTGETYIAKDAIENKNGNCLSLALVTTALAKLVDLDVLYQQVHTNPLYLRLNGMMTTSTHVRSIVLGPKPQKTEDSIILRGKVTVDYFPSSRGDRGTYISEADFASMFYQNMSAEVMTNDIALAYSLLHEAMQLNARNPSTLNSLAVLYRVHGFEEQARDLYEFAIENEIQSVHTLSNFAVLLDRQGDKETLEEIGKLYLKTDDDNPYRWIDLGDVFLSKEKYKDAKQSFTRAISTGPYLGEGYAGLAKVYYIENNKEKAEELMEKALSLLLPSQNRALYIAKFNAIKESGQ